MLVSALSAELPFARFATNGGSPPIIKVLADAAEIMQVQRRSGRSRQADLQPWL